MHNPLNIPLAKNIWACKRRSAGVKATPIQQAPPIMPNEVAKKFNKDGLNAVSNLSVSKIKSVKELKLIDSMQIETDTLEVYERK